MNRMITPSKAADVLGISTRAVYALIKTGALKASKMGHRTIRIDPLDLAEYVESKKCN